MLKIDKPADVLASLYADAEIRLKALVAEALASGALGTAAYRQQQLAGVQLFLGQLQDQAIPAASELVGRSYTLGAGMAEKTHGLSAEFGGVHMDAAGVIADSLATKLNGAAVQVGRKVDDLFRREGLRHVGLGLIEGAGRREASSAFAATLREQGVQAFTDALGREWGLGRYAAMAIRTTSREAVTQGTKNRLLENGLDLVTWASAGDADDEPCGTNDGETFSLTGTSDQFPALEEEPPVHPNCRCVLTPAAAV